MAAVEAATAVAVVAAVVGIVAAAAIAAVTPRIPDREGRRAGLPGVEPIAWGIDLPEASGRV